MNSAASQHSGSEPHQLVCVGVIFGSAGVKGAVRLKVFTEDVKSISSYGPVTVIGREFPEGKKFNVEILHNVKGGVAAKLKGVNDRDMADALKGSELFIDRKALPHLEEDNDYYFEDLVGLSVKDQKGDLFGRVDGVFNFGAGDIVEVNLEFEKGKRMYPFTNDVVPEVNIDAGYLVIDRDAFDDGAQDNTADKEG